METSLRFPDKKNYHLARSTGSILPIALAFSFFSLFLIVSLWFLVKGKQPTKANINSTHHQSISSSDLQQAPNPFQNQNKPLNQTSSPQTVSPSNNHAPFGNSNNTQLTEDAAFNLVNSWLTFKKTLFVDPFDTSNLDQYLIKPGKLHSDITKKGGSIDWLQQRNSYYKFNESKINKVVKFELFKDKAHLTVDVFEDIKLMTPTGIDPNQSGRKTRSWIYDLQKNQNGDWKIYDYRRAK